MVNLRTYAKDSLLPRLLTAVCALALLVGDRTALAQSVSETTTVAVTGQRDVLGSTYQNIDPAAITDTGSVLFYGGGGFEQLYYDNLAGLKSEYQPATSLFPSLGLELGFVDTVDNNRSGMRVVQATPWIYVLGPTKAVYGLTDNVTVTGIGKISSLFGPVIDSASRVAFFAQAPAGEGIFLATNAKTGTPIVKLAIVGQNSLDGGAFMDFASEQLSIATLPSGSPVVAFNADTTGSGNGLYLATQAGLTHVATGYHDEAKLGPSGLLVFNGDNGELILGAVDGNQTILSIGDPEPAGSTFDYFHDATVNSSGEIAFGAYVDATGADGVYLYSGGTVKTIAVNGAAPGGGTWSDFSPAQVNDAGQVLFTAIVQRGTNFYTGIFLGDGTDVVKVSIVGDLLAGSLVSSLTLPGLSAHSGSGLNNHGQVFFSATLANAKTGLFVFDHGSHYRPVADGSWDDASKWVLSALPAKTSNVFLDPDATVTVTGPLDPLSITSLQVGALTGTASATLNLQHTGTLTSAKKVIVTSNGILGGTGTIVGGVANQGQLNLDSTSGKIRVVGNLNLAATASTKVTLEGPSATPPLTVTGGLTLGGNLVVSLASGFVPQPGQSFSLFSAGAVGGKFASITLPTLSSPLMSWSKLGASGKVTVSGGTYFANWQGRYAGTIEAGTPTNADAGLFSLTLEEGGSFVATVKLGGVTTTVKGFLATDGSYSGALGKTGDNLNLQLDMTSGSGITASITQGGNTFASATAGLAASGLSKKNPSPYTGAYTLLLPADPAQTGADYPQGTGYARLTVSNTGAIRLAGTLGDQTAFSFGGTISASGDVAFYLPLYSKKGSISGTLNISGSGASSTVAGTLSWFKLASTAKTGRYLAGFSGSIPAMGSRYTPPLAPADMLPEGPATLTVAAGGLTFASPTHSLVIEPRNKVADTNVTEKFTLTLTASSGLFAGTFRDDAGKAHTFHGAVLQNQNKGGGLFLGTTQTGNVTLQPSAPGGVQ